MNKAWLLVTGGAEALPLCVSSDEAQEQRLWQLPWCHRGPWHSVLERWLHALPEVSRNCTTAGLGTRIMVFSSPNSFAHTNLLKISVHNKVMLRSVTTRKRSNGPLKHQLANQPTNHPINSSFTFLTPLYCRKITPGVKQFEYSHTNKSSIVDILLHKVKGK